MMEVDIDALADQLTSAANIVTNDGYYELDTDAVAKCLDKALETTRAELAAAHATIHQLGENAAKAAERVAVLEAALRECRRAVSGGKDEPRRNVREIVDQAIEEHHRQAKGIANA